MENIKVSIVGGAGFVGTYLAHRLVAENIGFDVLDISDEGIYPVIKADVTNLESLDELAGADVIVNLAAEHRDDVLPISRYDDVNVDGAINICLAARKHNIGKIIFTSSVAIYGFAPPNTGEDGVPNFFNDYGRTKYLAEKVYREWYEEDPSNRTLFIVRPTVIFGEGNRGNVYNLFRQISSGIFVLIGDGKNIKSLAYVKNVASFLTHAIGARRGLHIYNYVDKPDLDMITLIGLVRKTLGFKSGVGIKLPRVFGSLIGRLADIYSALSGKALPVSKIRVDKFVSTTQFETSLNATGFVPPFNVQEALQKTVRYEFLEDNKDKPLFYSE